MSFSIILILLRLIKSHTVHAAVAPAGDALFNHGAELFALALGIRSFFHGVGAVAGVRFQSLLKIPAELRVGVLCDRVGGHMISFL